MTTYKAQWPLSGDKTVMFYDANVAPPDRRPIFMSATDDLKERVFQNRYCKVLFEGTVTKDSVQVDQFVLPAQWLDRDPLTGEKVFE